MKNVKSFEEVPWELGVVAFSFVNSGFCDGEADLWLCQVLVGGVLDLIDNVRHISSVSRMTVTKSTKKSDREQGHSASPASSREVSTR